MHIDLDIEEALRLNNALLVDVRSEDEYLRDTIPGAVNIPILHNEDRAAVGLTYRREGENAAVRLGLRLVTPKLSEILATVRDAAGGRSLVVFCWRGGRRSLEVSRFFDQAQLPVYRIRGGYKAYRQHVREYLEQSDLPLQGIVLHGLTGVGKTQILLRLAQKGMPVLDLEGLAQHRGSVFGKIGMAASPTQKAFESHIVCLLKKALHKGFVLLECESRKVGNLHVPPLIMGFIHQGKRVLLYCSKEQRIQRIKETYAGSMDENIAILQEAIERLVLQLGRTRVDELKKCLEGKEYEQVIGFMLEHHYDPLYDYPAKPANGYELCVNTGDLEDAADRIHEFSSGLC